VRTKRENIHHHHTFLHHSGTAAAFQQQSSACDDDQGLSSTIVSFSSDSSAESYVNICLVCLFASYSAGFDK
jgi:hypothetical protein